MQSNPLIIPIDAKNVLSTLEPWIMKKKITEDAPPGASILNGNLAGIKNKMFIIEQAPTAIISPMNRNIPIS